MNTLNKLGGYLKGVGTNSLYQNIADYGTAAALGVAGQQAMNIASPGTDPNPLLSGVLAAPALTYGGRFLRGSINPEARIRDALFMQRQTTNPIEQAAFLGSGVGALAGGATSLYNTAATGADYDNNLLAGGAGALAALAPIAYSLIRNRKG